MFLVCLPIKIMLVRGSRRGRGKGKQEGEEEEVEFSWEEVVIDVQCSVQTFPFIFPSSSWFVFRFKKQNLGGTTQEFG